MGIKNISYFIILCLLLSCAQEPDFGKSINTTPPLFGLWKKECEEFAITYQEFSNNLYSLEWAVHYSSDCAGESNTKVEARSYNNKIVYSGEYSKYSFEITEVYVTPLDSGTVGFYNGNAQCGYSNWQLNVPVNVTHFPICSFNAYAETGKYLIGKITQSIFKIVDGNKLYNSDFTFFPDDFSVELSGEYFTKEE